MASMQPHGFVAVGVAPPITDGLPLDMHGKAMQCQPRPWGPEWPSRDFDGRPPPNMPC